MKHARRIAAAAASLFAASVLAAPAAAQFGNAWVEFTLAPAQPSTGALSDPSTEVDFTTGDLDGDGRTDLVVVRKQAHALPGKRPNVLLMNGHGVLVDRTALFASASTIPGDMGFLTPTCDRDAAVVDVNGDGWLDVVTVVQRSHGDPKHISHPRVYLNLGEDENGQWLGLRFEDGRFPQLLSFTSGQAVAPNFNAVGAGDVTGDGFVDLYFADIDPPGPGGLGKPPGQDTNNRLLVNDGHGYFVDQSQWLMTAPVLQAGYSFSAQVIDMNLDGADDVLKHSSVFDPLHVAVVYNDAANPGEFSLYQPLPQMTTSYAVAGDLNQDGRPDLVQVEDFSDRFRLNLGNDALGRVIWSNALPFQFLAGGDEGFGGRAHLADLDGDGWNDVLITDQPFEFPIPSTRLHIYHNRGTVPGAVPALVEEREHTGPGGWLGVVGLGQDDLAQTYDVATLDVDGDGDLDLLIGRKGGTFLWRNETLLCQEDLGGASPGGAELRLCGAPLTQGALATLTLEGTSPNSPFGLVLGTGAGALPLLGGTLIPSPILAGPILVTGPAGSLVAPITGVGPAPDLYVQALVLDGPAFVPLLSNALRVQFP